LGFSFFFFFYLILLIVESKPQLRCNLDRKISNEELLNWSDGICLWRFNFKGLGVKDLPKGEVECLCDPKKKWQSCISVTDSKSCIYLIINDNDENYLGKTERDFILKKKTKDIQLKNKNKQKQKQDECGYRIANSIRKRGYQSNSFQGRLAWRIVEQAENCEDCHLSNIKFDLNTECNIVSSLNEICGIGILNQVTEICPKSCSNKNKGLIIYNEDLFKSEDKQPIKVVGETKDSESDQDEYSHESIAYDSDIMGKNSFSDKESEEDIILGDDTKILDNKLKIEKNKKIDSESGTPELLENIQKDLESMKSKKPISKKALITDIKSIKKVHKIELSESEENSATSQAQEIKPKSKKNRK